MLETIITTSQAIRWTLAMAGFTAILSIGMLAITAWLLNEFRKDLAKFDDYITQHIIDKAVSEAIERDNTCELIQEDSGVHCSVCEQWYPSAVVHSSSMYYCERCGAKVMRHDRL